MRILFLFFIFLGVSQADYMDINSTSPELNFQYMTMGNLLGFTTTFMLLLVVILGGRK